MDLLTSTDILPPNQGSLSHMWLQKGGGVKTAN